MSQQSPLFQLLTPKRTGVTFENKIRETEEFNVLSYEYFYNGGGVAIGDINNDNLLDIFFTANMKPDKLYLNQGGLTFRDVTKKAGLISPDGWKTGVTMADVNADGWVDIYICHSGSGNSESRRNRLYINNHDLTFTEEAEAYGLHDVANSTHAAFFDYDRDGDLDMYLLNHSTKDFKDVELTYVKKTYDSLAGDKLYQNRGGFFTDVSEKAGIKGNPLGFGLGVSVADINNDHWPDIYVSNDYREHDYLYINNQDGTFTDRVREYLGHISEFSMGNDVADINNDGLVDIITLDMLPEDNRRQKLLQGPENYELHKTLVENGFHYQYMRNMLQVNNGNGTFSEIGQLAGISNTDWSWAPLFADFDNDGQKDLFITNGYLRDYTNKDFLKFWGRYVVEKAMKMEPALLMDLVTSMPSTVTSNYIYQNQDGYTLANKVKEWGFDLPALSNGAAYADLDNDGDVELVINNVNQEAFIYQNMSIETGSDKFLQVELKGAGKNTSGIGAKIRLYQNGAVQLQEQIPSRGFQSAVSPVLHFGLSDDDLIDSLTVIWSDGHSQKLYNIAAKQRLSITQQEQSAADETGHVHRETFFASHKSGIEFTHKEYPYNDFKRQPLMPFMLSHAGPVLAVGDVNNDGLDDLFVGASKGQESCLFVQQSEGSFKRSNTFFDDKLYSATGACFFDSDNDGDMDLYVASGMYDDYREGMDLLADRLYLNHGDGHFTEKKDIPQLATAKSCVKPADYDQDGDLDLFLGGRVVPGRYPETPTSYLLQNDGNGNFEDVTDQVAPELRNLGMITDASWSDIDNDGKPDLVLIGDWMPITLFRNGGGTLIRQTNFFGKDFSGLWTRLKVEDADGDGDLDMMVGNLGTNSQMKASAEKPAELIYADFDRNGSVDPFLCFYNGDKAYPYVTRDELLDQIYSLRKQFTSYESYADATLADIFSDEDLQYAQRLTANTLATTIFENVEGTFVERELPIQSQFSPLHAIEFMDVNSDGRKDMLLFGNNEHMRLRLGKMDSNYGILLLNEGDFSYKYVPQPVSGFNIIGDVKDVAVLKTGDNDQLVVLGINNGPLKIFKRNCHEQ